MHDAASSFGTRTRTPSHAGPAGSPLPPPWSRRGAMRNRPPARRPALAAAPEQRTLPRSRASSLTAASGPPPKPLRRVVSSELEEATAQDGMHPMQPPEAEAAVAPGPSAAAAAAAATPVDRALAGGPRGGCDAARRGCGTPRLARSARSRQWRSQRERLTVSATHFGHHMQIL